MSGPIQVVPAGLLGLLQLKQTGANPRDLLDTVQPSVDLLDSWRQARMLDAMSLPNWGANPSVTQNTPTGYNVFLVGGVAAAVPTNQWWYIDQLAVQLVIPAAADTCRFQPACSMNPGVAPQQQYAVGPDVADVASARLNRQLWARADRSFWAPPGSTFGVRVFDAVTATNLVFTLYLRAVPLPS